MSDATGNADDATPDETFGRFEDDPILGELFVPRGEPPRGDAAPDADAAADTDATDADATDAETDAADAETKADAEQADDAS